MKRNFIPGTECSRRRPTPTEFAHLRKWVEEVKRSVKITNITEMTNINQQLEQNAELYVSNIISRVIAQLIGEYGDGFVTLKATSDGKLKVESTLVAAGTVGLEAGANLIGKVQAEGTSQTVLQVAISGSYSGGVELIAANATKKIKIVNIFLVVSGAVSLKFMSDTTNLTGIMELGDTDEPRGMVIPFGNFPMETAVNKNFKLHADGATAIMGYCNYYLE